MTGHHPLSVQGSLTMQGPTVRLTVLEPTPAPVTTDPYAVSGTEAKLRRQKALYRSAFKGV